MPMFGYVNPLRGEPLTGEPDAGEPPVRFGGRGNETNRLFLPLSTLNKAILRITIESGIRSLRSRYSIEDLDRVSRAQRFLSYRWGFLIRDPDTRAIK
jgi:hypothetical protein